MTSLLTEPRLAKPDDLYERLIGMHQGLTDEESAIANAKLILILMNHIGDDRVLLEAIELVQDQSKRVSTEKP